MTKLLTYYTSLRPVGYTSPNPKAVYINLSCSAGGTPGSKRLKTHIITNGHVIDIPRWVMTDHLRIGEILLPDRKLLRQHKDKLTVSPELVEMLRDRGYRYGNGVGQHARIGSPGLDAAEVVALSFAESVRGDVSANKMTVNDMLRKIVESYQRVRPHQSSDDDAIRECMRVCGWHPFEISMALYWYAKSKRVSTG